MRRRHPIGCLAATLVIGAALAAPVRAAEVSNQEPAQALRVCADPDDLPFSSARPGAPGLYIEVGQLIAQALGRPLEPVWSLSYFGKRAVRTTLLAKTCDAYIGLPGAGFMGPQVIYSKPFLQVGFALMEPREVQVTRLSDLTGKRVAVQFSTPPQMVLARRDDVQGVTFLNPDEAARALGRHEVDAAFIWGPTAGYINASVLHGEYHVVPVAGEGMQYPVTIGFKKADAALRDQVNTALDANAPAIAGLAAKYGLPTTTPIALASRNDRQQTMFVLAAADDPDVKDKPAPAPEPEQQAAASPELIDEGHKIFNGTCSHCHGPDAVQSVRKIDLRLLHHRYGDDMQNVFHETVTHGRPAKGMPNWSQVFSEEDFTKIFAYLKSIQTD